MANENVIDLEAANLRLLAKRRALRDGTTSASTPSLAGEEVQRVAAEIATKRQAPACGDCRADISDARVELWFSEGRRGRPICEDCEGRRRVEAAERRRAQIDDLCRRAGVDDEFRGAALSDFAGATRASAESFLASCRTGSAKGLLVAGEWGNGKTRLACALVRHWLLAGRSARFVMARELLGGIWGTYRDGSEKTEAVVIDELQKVNLLVIDDLGKEGRVSEGGAAVWHSVLSRRSGNFRPTIVTTNCAIRDLRERYDYSIVSRLLAFDAIAMVGDDWRQRRPA